MKNRKTNVSKDKELDNDDFDEDVYENMPYLETEEETAERIADFTDCFLKKILVQIHKIW